MTNETERMPRAGMQDEAVTMDDPRGLPTFTHEDAAEERAAIARDSFASASAAPLSSSLRNGGFASPSRDGFALCKTLQGNLLRGSRRRVHLHEDHRYA